VAPPGTEAPQVAIVDEDEDEVDLAPEA